jgi:hypothetical protein
VFYTANKEKGERKMNKMSKVSSYFLVAMLLLGVFFVATPASVKAVPPTTVALVNPVDGTNNFVYTTSEKDVGDFVIINVTITDVLNMSGWQMSISWNASLLSYNSFKLPSDNVFAYDSPVSASSADPAGGNVVGGANLGPDAPYYFDGNGTLARLNLTIIQGVGMLPPTTVQCDLEFTNVGSTGDSFLLSGSSDIPFTPVNGFYHYYWVEPPTIPKLYLKPSEIKPAANDTTFAVDVMVENVYAGWEITCFQFSVMWNTSLIGWEGFSHGTFLEAFNYGDGVIYANDTNAHIRILPLHPIPDDYNYTIIGELLLPDMADPWNGTYHTPYPQSIVPAKLATLTFKAINSTVAPEEVWTWIDFIAEDVLVLNQYNTDIGYTSLTGAHYRAPQSVVGLSIDVYTGYPYPYGGQGGNMTSDSFGPQQEVCLTALVTYNEYPVQQKLVGFQIYHQGATQGYNFAREGTTGTNGIAHISFRLPWPCNDPVNEIFGWWYVNATVEVAEQVVVDNLKFWVWWPVEVVSIEPKFTEGNSVVQTKQGCTMNFTMHYRRFDAQPKDVLLTAAVYDELGFFIGSAYHYDTVSNDPVAYDNVTGEPIPNDYYWDFQILIPSNAVVGKCTIFGNAFTDWPWLGGYPYCPEVTNTLDFYIKKP